MTPRSIPVLFTIALAALTSNAGCGGGTAPSTAGASSSATSSGTGGEGGSTVTASSTASSATTGAGGAGGAPVDLTSIGDPDCAFTWKKTAPIFGESETTSSPPLPIHEDGALAAVRFTPPVYPWTATSATYSLGLAAGICELMDHDVVAFVGPAGAPPPVHPIAPVVTTVFAAELSPSGGVAEVTVTLAAPVVVHAGEVLWIGVKLRATSATERTCIRTCRGGGTDPASWWSEVDQNTGLPYQCPEASCSLIPLAESPNKVDAQANGNDDKRIVITVHGHP